MHLICFLYVDRGELHALGKRRNDRTAQEFVRRRSEVATSVTLAGTSPPPNGPVAGLSGGTGNGGNGNDLQQAPKWHLKYENKGQT